MKRRRLGSVLALAIALLLIVSSLAGTTVAWFTGKVTSSNRIQSGPLDVEMKYYNKLTARWEDVEPTTKIVDTSRLYLPGSIETVLLQAENAGSLALKYKLGITAVNRRIGTSVNSTEIRLTDYLQAGAWVLDETDLTADSFASYSNVFALISEDAKLPAEQRKMKPLVEYAESEIKDAVAGTVTREQKASVLLSDRVLLEAPAADSTVPAQNTETIALVFYIPIEIGNEMNFRGQQPQIAVGVHLLAGQASVESDSFDSSYDKDANYPKYKMKLDSAAEPNGAETGTAENENLNP